QALGQLKEVKSRSSRGLSIVTASMKDEFDKSRLPQVWDELRRKVGDAQGRLPPGAGPSIVNDDFGDVFGVLFAIYGEEYSYAELYDVAKLLRRELLLVQDVAKVEIYGYPAEVVYIELDRDRMSQTGVPIRAVIDELQARNIVTNSGRVQVGSEFITIEPSGVVNSVEDLGNTLITGAPGGAQVYLRDIANIRRGVQDPPTNIIRYDGKPAVGIGISTIAGGNVVTMGEGLYERMFQLVGDIPLGIDFGIISLQSESVTTAINGFVVSLAQAIAIVVVVLLFFMGIRSGLLIGFVLLLTICGSLILMASQGVALERISLGALIIALGMLVDNAIVVVDGMLVRFGAGEDREQAAIAVVKQQAVPLFGATAIAILAFAAIGTSQDSTGEYTRSLYQVILFSLGFSWVTAVTVTPLLGVMFLETPKVEGDPYGGRFYRGFKGFLGGALRLRWLTMGCVVAVFAASVWGFGAVEQSFFPNSTRPQFMVDFWMPEGTHIRETEEKIAEIEEYLGGIEGVRKDSVTGRMFVSSSIGGGFARFLLTYVPEKTNSAYAQLLVDVDDSNVIDAMMLEVQEYLERTYPEAIPQTRKFILGPGEPGKIQAKFVGTDPDVLRGLAEQARAIIEADPRAFGIQLDWRDRVKVVRPLVAEEQANANGITRRDISMSLLQGFQGIPVGVYREADELLPLILRAPDEQRVDVTSIQNLQIWSPAAGRQIPVRQVVSGFETTFEDQIIERMNRRQSVTVRADPRVGEASPLFLTVRPQIEAIPLPEGYELEWWGEYKDSGEAQAALAGSLPMFLLLMVLVTLALFNSLKQTAIIWLVVPLAIIGVTIGLLSTSQPFGFMAMLGFLSLSGMLIKNAIVLIDQINLEIREGKTTWDAILDSAVSRLRPVGMAAATTILGMAPLFPDAFFVSMAVTVAFGLGFATILTMVVVPTLYAVFFRAQPGAAQAASATPAPSES
ncbi:MAG: efflux RND transporter permease subunit, partial [Gemmatimonadota bacterium]|nr:efflux RND transporter permease subunit [Gemmatimonadota bacterium]